MADLRSLICDSTGIVIGELVYRCMKCVRTFDLSHELFEHYQKIHTTSASTADAFAAQVQTITNRRNGNNGGGQVNLADYDSLAAHRLPRSLAITPSNTSISLESGNGIQPKRLKMSHPNPSNVHTSNLARALQPTITFSVPSDLRELQQNSSSPARPSSNGSTRQSSASGSNSGAAASLPSSTTLKSLLTSGKKALVNGGSNPAENIASSMLASMSNQASVNAIRHSVQQSVQPGGGLESQPTIGVGQVLRNTDPDNPSQNVRGGYVTCEVCNMMKYYSSHLSRRFGVYSCEACAKFFRRYLIRPKDYRCDRDGNCDLTVATPGGRCKACLLKACLAKYVVDLKRYPKIVEQNKQELVNQAVDHNNSRLLVANLARTTNTPQQQPSPAASRSHAQHPSSSLKIKSEGDVDQSQSSLNDQEIDDMEPEDEEEDDDEDNSQSDAPAEQYNQQQVSPLKILLKNAQPAIKKVPAAPEESASSMEAPKLGIFMKKSDFASKGLDAIKSPAEDDDDDDEDEEEEEDEAEEIDDEEGAEVEQYSQEDGDEGNQLEINPNEPPLEFDEEEDQEDGGGGEMDYDMDNQEEAVDEEEDNQVESNLLDTDIGEATIKSEAVMEAAMSRSLKPNGAAAPLVATRNLATRLPPIKRALACKVCEACLANDCGECTFCMDKPKFGGTGQRKQKCIKRRCTGVGGSGGGEGSNGGGALSVY